MAEHQAPPFSPEKFRLQLLTLCGGHQSITQSRRLLGSIRGGLIAGEIPGRDILAKHRMSVPHRLGQQAGTQT